MIRSPHPALNGDCLARGTRLETGERGPVSVEHLRPGDILRLARGGSAPVTWVGSRRVDCRRHPQPHSVRPVRVSRGALNDAIPCRDVLLSPDHAVFVAGVLVPIGLLINGATIAQESPDVVEYFHVELGRHDIMIADGLPVESFLGGTARMAYDDAPARQLHPCFARPAWEKGTCLPVVLAGPEFQAAIHLVRKQARLIRKARAQSSYLAPPA